MKLQGRGDKPASAAVVGCGFAVNSQEEDEPILFHIFLPPTATFPSFWGTSELRPRETFPHFPDDAGDLMRHTQ